MGLKKIKHSPDDSKINKNQDQELREWADKFAVTKVRLKAAINAVGDPVKDLEAYLKVR
jgi:hypothetical protein